MRIPGTMFGTTQRAAPGRLVLLFVALLFSAVTTPVLALPPSV
jgi:hypothetical protein